MPIQCVGKEKLVETLAETISPYEIVAYKRKQCDVLKAYRIRTTDSRYGNL